MSNKIPFLDMFSHLRRRRDLAEAVAIWQIVSASIDKAELSITVKVEGAAGAGANLLRDAEEGICRAYGLRSAKVVVLQPRPVVKAEPPKPAAKNCLQSRFRLQSQRINLLRMPFPRRRQFDRQLCSDPVSHLPRLKQKKRVPAMPFSANRSVSLRFQSENWNWIWAWS